jgi:hypothetical protein
MEMKNIYSMMFMGLCPEIHIYLKRPVSLIPEIGKVTLKVTAME